MEIRPIWFFIEEQHKQKFAFSRHWLKPLFPKIEIGLGNSIVYHNGSIKWSLESIRRLYHLSSYKIKFCTKKLEKEMATLSSILAWRIPWTEEPGGLQSMGLQRVRHDWATVNHSLTQEAKCWIIGRGENLVRKAGKGFPKVQILNWGQKKEWWEGIYEAEEYCSLRLQGRWHLAVSTSPEAWMKRERNWMPWEAVRSTLEPIR